MTIINLVHFELIDFSNKKFPLIDNQIESDSNLEANAITE